MANSDNRQQVAARFRVSYEALRRHQRDHLSAVLVKIHEAREEYREVRERASALNIAAELGVMLERQRLLTDACDRWLRDPDNHEQYDVGPRAEEVSVIYETVGEDGKVVRRKDLLRTLIRRIEGELGAVVTGTVIKQSDIRELSLKGQAAGIQAIQTVADLLERSWELQSKMDEAAKIGVMSETEVRVGLREMLRETCGLSEKATDAFMLAVERGARVRAVEQMEADLEGEVEDG